jgi:hypothetical protein
MSSGDKQSAQTPPRAEVVSEPEVRVQLLLFDANQGVQWSAAQAALGTLSSVDANSPYGLLYIVRQQDPVPLRDIQPYENDTGFVPEDELILREEYFQAVKTLLGTDLESLHSAIDSKRGCWKCRIGDVIVAVIAATDDDDLIASIDRLLAARVLEPAGLAPPGPDQRA